MELDNKKTNFVTRLATVLTIVLIIVGVGIYWLFADMSHFSKAPEIEAGKNSGSIGPTAVVFNPPKPEDAPANIRNAVMLGYNIMMNTQKYAKGYVGNKLNCRNCHFEGGMQRETLSLVGVAAKYPKYRTRSGYATDLVTRTQGCFERSMNGKPLPPEGKMMQAIMAYYHWISKGIPIYADVPWLGLKKLKSTHKPDPTKGALVYKQECARCHGIGGQGTDVAPPLWGPDSFNNGAGMHKVKNFAAFTYHFMPKNSPSLTEAQALDVAGYVTEKPRPVFHPVKKEE